MCTRLWIKFKHSTEQVSSWPHSSVVWTWKFSSEYSKSSIEHCYDFGVEENLIWCAEWFFFYWHWMCSHHVKARHKEIDSFPHAWLFVINYLNQLILFHESSRKMTDLCSKLRASPIFFHEHLPHQRKLEHKYPKKRTGNYLTTLNHPSARHINFYFYRFKWLSHVLFSLYKWHSTHFWCWAQINCLNELMIPVNQTRIMGMRVA